MEGERKADARFGFEASPMAARAEETKEEGEGTKGWRRETRSGREAAGSRTVDIVWR